MSDDEPEADKGTSWDDAPWELPGNCRLDSLPHRGQLLRWLANTSFLVALASYYPCVINFPIVCCLFDQNKWQFFWIPAEILGLWAVVCGVGAVGIANSDLAAMRKGIVDPGGVYETGFARRRAVWGIVAGLGSIFLWGGLAFIV